MERRLRAVDAAPTDDDMVVAILDVSRAHFHPMIKRKVHIELPEEDKIVGQDMVGELLRTMYGTRDAAASWEEFYTEVLEAAGAKSGDFSPCLFHSVQTNLRIWVHGDDKALVGKRSVVMAMIKVLEGKMMIKTKAMLGFARGDDRSATLLNRIIELKVIGGKPTLCFEPDPRHAQIAIRDLGLDGEKTKGLSAPGANDETFEDATLIEERSGQLRFRSVAMRLSFLGQDSPHLQQPVKEASRLMQVPTVGALNRLKRIGRYLVEHPRCVQHFVLQPRVEEVVVKSDSDHAGCKRTRKSTSCALLMHGLHLLLCSSTTQKIEGLSSCESEFLALVKAGSIGMGAKAMAKDFGMDLKLKLETDSSGAKGVAARRGVGRIRHLHTPLLWLQRRVADRTLRSCRHNYSKY